MPKTKELRPDLTRPASASPSASTGWVGRATSWLRSASGSIVGKEPGDSIVEGFARLSASAREPEEVRVELVRLAALISKASRVELFNDQAGQGMQRLASWPPTLPVETTTGAASSPRGPIQGPRGRSIPARQAPLVLPLRAGPARFGTLRLTAPGRKPWPDHAVRQLSALCAIASIAERGMARPGRSDLSAPIGLNPGAQGAMLLAAFLSFAQAQSRRRHEPLSILEVGVDRLDSIRELLGDELAEMAIDRVSRAIRSTIRASDIVTPLEDGRIAVLLPNASTESARRVAEAVRSAIARAGAASTTMPSLTASIGVANYPDHAHDAASLRAAVASSLTQAQAEGYDRIVVADSIPALNAPTLIHRVG